MGDVVRVRLQSQPTTPSPLTTISKLAASSPQSFSTLPPNLGVTACCREVFFATNNVEVCMAAPRIGAIGAECAVEETQKRSYNSTFDGLRKIARNEGVSSLWRGLSPTLVMTVPANIIYFTGYDWLRFNNRSPINRYCSDTYAPLISGATARIVAATAVGPIEMFRTRLQASRSTGGAHFAETVQGMGEMIAAHGYTSLWRGLTLTMWRDVPFSGIYWLGYESIRGLLTEAGEKGRGRSLAADGSRVRARSRSQSRENHYNTFLDSFIAGAEKALAPEERSMPRFLWHIFREEGLAGLWRGWIPRTLKIAPSCAIMISCYEVGKRAFRSVNERAEKKKTAV